MHLQGLKITIIYLIKEIKIDQLNSEAGTRTLDTRIMIPLL